MRSTLFAVVLVLSASASAQDMQSMPGMKMPATPKKSPPARHRSGPAKKAASEQSQSMPGMPMGGQQPAKPAAGADMHDMQGMHTDSPMTQAPVNGSITHDTMGVQEAENPEHRTGSNLPAPDLLREVGARPAMPLSDFVAMADKTNPTLAQASAYVQRSGAQARQAGLYPNPSVGYQGEQIRGGSYGGGEQGAFLQQMIVLGGKRALRRNIYNQQKQSDQIGVEEQTYRVHADLIQAFYAALTSQAKVDVQQRLVGLSLDAVGTAHQLANVGQADAPDILQSEVEAEQAKIDFVTAQREFIQNFRVLAALAGTPELPVRPLSGALEAPPEFDAEQQVAAIVSSSPSVRRRQQEVAIGEARLQDARRESVPDIQLRVGEQYNFEHVSEMPVKAAGPQSFASAGINVPLWNRNQGNVDAAEAEIQRARQEVTRTQLSLQRTAEPLAQSYLSARFTAERYRTQLIPRAQRAYDLYLMKYQSMAGAYPQVLVSQRTLFQLQIGYLSALHDIWANAVALQNFTLSGGLEAPMSTGSASTTINLPGTGGSVE